MRLKIRMSHAENARMALTTLHENKMRSFLTVLGVVIGITALLSVVAVLVGVYNDVGAFLSDFGTDTFFIFKFDPGVHTSGRLTADERTRKPLTLEDAEAIGEQCPDVKAVSAAVMPRVDENNPGGRPLQSARYKNKDVAGVSYEVIGVMAARKGQLMKDQAADKAILVPYRTYQKHRPADDENLIGAVAYPGRMPEAKDEIRAVLRRRRHVPYDKPDNFGVSSAQEIADQFRQITASVALLISVVSSIGLLVGGVGVMNIMLMS